MYLCQFGLIIGLEGIVLKKLFQLYNSGDLEN